jgi:hypothetical protein
MENKTLNPAPDTSHLLKRTNDFSRYTISHSFRNLAYLILILLTSVSCLTRKKLVEPGLVILPLGDTVHLREGSLVYALPRTVFKVKIDVERRIEKAGPYAKYAGDLLGLKDPITQDKETWSVTGINVISSEELDPSEFYVIETNTLFQTNVLALKKEGLILDINRDYYERSGENRINKSLSGSRPGYSDLGADEYFVTQSDTAYKVVKLDTTFIKIPYLVEKKKQLTLDQLAEKAAKSLLELRDGKHMILTGEANVFPQSNSAIDEINRMEADYLALFAGKIRTEAKTYSFTFIPQKETSGKPVTLLRFSNQSGVLDSPGNLGTPVTIKMTPPEKTRNISVVLKPVAAGAPAPRYEKLYYRVPQIVSVEIKMGEEKLYNDRKLIYQFGQIVQLPGNYIIGK